MALMYAQFPRAEPIERAVKLVMSRQRPVCPFSAPSFQLAFTEFFLIHRTAPGLKKRLRASSIKPARFRTLILSSHFQFGCWARRTSI